MIAYFEASGYLRSQGSAANDGRRRNMALSSSLLAGIGFDPSLLLVFVFLMLELC